MGEDAHQLLPAWKGMREAECRQKGASQLTAIEISMIIRPCCHDRNALPLPRSKSEGDADLCSLFQQHAANHTRSSREALACKGSTNSRCHQAGDQIFTDISQTHEV